MAGSSANRPALDSDRRLLWLAAIKPPMYSVAIMPIWLGSMAAYAATGHLDRPIFCTFLASAILILAWENLSNDVFDAETGIDRNKAHSLVNLTDSKTLIFWLGNLCLGLGLLGMISISVWLHDGTVLALILACCFLGYCYQGPPFRLGYLGLGEPLCFLSFGPLAIAAVYYSQTQTWSIASQIVAVIVGITTTLVLFCSHFHQVEDDLAAGKRSPVVRLGTALSAKLLPWSCVGIYGVLTLGLGLGYLPIWTSLSFAALPWAIKLCRFVGKHHAQPAAVQNCKFIAVAFHFWSGLLLGLGFLLTAIA
ncbi:MAG: 2-carboxy-1,4-naphthoquinone phytyltransferase [Cyanobacteria bacterium P01_H01_bin.121]